MTSFSLIDGTSLMVDSDGSVYGPRGIRKQTLGTNGYLGVSIAGNGRRETHRMVAISFIPNPEGKREVAHWDGVKTHSRADNLSWATREENRDDRRRHNDWGTKLSNQDVAQIRALLDQGYLYQYEIAKLFDITQPAVSQIKLGKSWKGRD